MIRISEQKFLNIRLAIPKIIPVNQLSKKNNHKTTKRSVNILSIMRKNKMILKFCKGTIEYL